jgi:oxygen-independent coproporphyrinogen-3 oxidase
VLAGESPVAESEVLSAEDRARERLVIGLRRMDGVNRSEFEILCGVKIEELVGSELEAILGMGLLEWTGDWLRLTRDGLFVSDSIWSRFLRR